MSDAQEPLIANAHEGEAEGGNDSFEEDDDTHPVLGKLPEGSSLGLFIWLLAFSAGISGLLFGCRSALSCNVGQDEDGRD